MNFEDIIKKDSQGASELNKQIDNIRQLNNALYSGDTNVYSFDINSKPLGSRYFIENKEKIKNDNGDLESTYYIVDNMKYGKTNGKIDLNKAGLLYSVEENLNNIDSEIKLEGLEDLDSTFVEVVLVSDKDDKLTDKKKISLRQYLKLDCTAFPDNCKRYTGMADGHCDTCDIIPKKKETISNNPDVIQDPSEYLNEENVDEVRDQMVGNALNEAKNTPAMDTSTAQGFRIMGNGVEPFYNRYSQPLHRFETLQTNSYPTETIIKTEKFSNDERLIIEKDMITTLYLGGITALALFVVAKFI